MNRFHRETDRRAFVLSLAVGLSASGFGVLAAAEPVAELAKKLESDDHQTSREAFAELRKLALWEYREEGKQAKAAITDYQARCQAFFQKHGISERDESLRILTEQKIPLAEMRYVFSAKPVTELAVVAPQFGDEHLRYLAGFTTFIHVTLQDTGITGATLSSLPAKKIKILWLNGSAVQEEQLAKIAFSALGQISVANTSVSNRILKELQAPELTHLQFGGTKIDKDGLAFLPRFKKLQSIRCDLSLFTRETLMKLVGENPALGHVNVVCKVADFDQVVALKPALGKNCWITMYVPGLSGKETVELNNRVQEAKAE